MTETVLPKESVCPFWKCADSADMDYEVCHSEAWRLCPSAVKKVEKQESKTVYSVLDGDFFEVKK
jgi:hypothetical protein